jgi:DNA-directed RNA polymerase sigma subunit (sigma70/sigma32)
MYSISRERARQLEKQLVNKLRGYLKRELGESVVEIALERAA